MQCINCRVWDPFTDRAFHFSFFFFPGVLHSAGLLRNIPSSLAFAPLQSSLWRSYLAGRELEAVLSSQCDNGDFAGIRPGPASKLLALFPCAGRIGVLLAFEQ
jgi:hypothetical protein